MADKSDLLLNHLFSNCLGTRNIIIKGDKLLPAFWAEESIMLWPKPIFCFITAKQGNISANWAVVLTQAHSWDSISNNLVQLQMDGKNREEENITLKHRINKKDEVVQTLNSHLFKCSGGMSWRRHITALWILSPFIYLDRGLVLLVENIALRLPRWLTSGKTCLKRLCGYTIENVFIEV